MRNKKKGNLDGCVHEVELYIKNITDKFGSFEYAPSKINYDPKKEEEQIKILYPKVKLIDLTFRYLTAGPWTQRGSWRGFRGSMAVIKVKLIKVLWSLNGLIWMV